MALLNREAILGKDDLKKEVVSVPEWGGDVVVSTMTGAARDEWEQSLITNKTVNMNNIRARLIVATVVDEKGERLFDLGDVEALGKKSAAALDRCVKVAQKLNRLTENELEDLSKN